MPLTTTTAAAGELLCERAGLRATVATEARLESCLARGATRCGVSVDAYLTCLRTDGRELQSLIDEFTVQETSFFRDPSHFAALVRAATSRCRPPGPVIVWSAGCATGPEPYSIAIALDEAGVRDWSVVATDLSERAVARVRDGRYREPELRGLSPARRGRYLVRDGAAWRIDPRLAERVSVVRHNLLTDPPPVAVGEATAIFCRNVLIYLRRDRVAPFLAVARQRLARDGLVFLGGSESLWRVPDGFALERLGDAFAYRRIDGPRAATHAPRRSFASPPAARAVHEVMPVEVVESAPPSAIETFRRATYTAPTDPLAHLQLAFSLEAVGDLHAARRAFRAARAALDRADREELEARLEGYETSALRTVIDLRLAGEASCR